MYFYDGNTLILTVEEPDCSGGILMRLKGQLRSETAHFIQSELEAFTTAGNGINVWIDCKEVTFACPSFYIALLNAQHTIDYFRKGQLVLRNIPDPIYQEMDDEGLTELLMIED